MRGDDVAEPPGAGGATGDDGVDEPALCAERLFVTLTRQADPGRNGIRPPPEMQRPVDQAQPPEDEACRPDASPAEEEVRELVLAALAATDRIAEVVAIVSSQADASAAHLASLGQAVEQALEATNSRLAAIERIVHERTAGDTGAAQPADKAMARLRRTLGR